MIGARAFLAAATLAALLPMAPAPAATPQASDPPSSLTLPGTTRVDGIPIAELSGLAWAADDQVLYAVSDQGVLVQFRLDVDGGQLAAVAPLRAFALTDPQGVVPGGGPRFNAEGLVARNGNDGEPGNTELIVALEEDPPRIVRFSPEGVALDLLDVPAPAADVHRYEKKGRGLESTGWSQKWGVMTAPEAPLAGTPQGQHTVYASDASWSFARRKADSRLKAFELMPDNRLLVLERSREGSKKQQTASLRLVHLDDCAESSGCTTQTLAVLPTGPDNFEGLAVLAPGQALLVSDNGGKVDADTVFALVPLQQ